MRIHLKKTKNKKQKNQNKKIKSDKRKRKHYWRGVLCEHFHVMRSLTCKKKICPGDLLILYTTCHRMPGNVLWNGIQCVFYLPRGFAFMIMHVWSPWCVCCTFITAFSFLNHQNSSLWDFKEIVLISWYFSVWKHCQQRRVREAGLYYSVLELWPVSIHCDKKQTNKQTNKQNICMNAKQNWYLLDHLC